MLVLSLLRYYGSLDVSSVMVNSEGFRPFLANFQHMLSKFQLENQSIYLILHPEFWEKLQMLMIFDVTEIKEKTPLRRGFEGNEI